MENGYTNCPISENARRYPHHCALIDQERTWTYQELNTAVQSLCHHLAKTGIKENQRVAFLASSIPSTILLFFALLRLRAVACPLSVRIPKELLPKYYELLKPAHILEPGSLPLAVIADLSYAHSVHLDQLATFLFTSGSSGPSKIACHRLANHYYNAMGAIAPLQLEVSSRWLLSLPLFHVSGIGILFRCFLRGATVVLANLTSFETISQFKISHISLVPTQLYRLLKEPPELIETMKQTLKCILLGGAPIPPSLLDSAYKFALPIVITYGMTEMSSIITLSNLNAREGCGRAVLYRNLKIEKDQEIWVGGKTLFNGYWDAARETIVKVNQNDWFPTKDLGRFTEDQQLEVLGRKDRLFISGGENIQPEDIERALCSLAGIRQASVLPIADSEFGQRPIAFIDGDADDYSVDSIREKLRDILPRFMHPIRIFRYPSSDASIKPSLLSLKQHLSQILKSSGENQE
jgi:O-succinylbenzoic acid--CoA ligase